jgi:hypothetical protein
VARRTIRVIDVVELSCTGTRAPDRRAVLVARRWTRRPCASTSPQPSEAGLVPGRPPLSAEQWAALVEGWFPELVDRSRRQKTWPEIEPHRQIASRTGSGR